MISLPTKMMMMLLPLVALSQMSLAAPQAHSIEKRQTTVTFTSKYEDIRELVLNIVVAFTFATLAVVVIAPLFGYKLDLLVSTFNDLAPQQEDEILATQAVDSGYGGYTAPSYTARSLQGSSWPSIGSRILASIDIVDTTFNYMDIDSDHCRLRTVCEMESYAANNPIARLAINTVNSNLRGLEKYSEAVEAGLARQDCALLYDQCQTSYFGF